jgi:hypothetical protein
VACLDIDHGEGIVDGYTGTVRLLEPDRIEDDPGAEAKS